MKFAPLIRASLLVSAVALVPATTASLAAVDGRAGPQFGRLLTIYQIVKANYVESVDDEKLINGAIAQLALRTHEAMQNARWKVANINDVVRTVIFMCACSWSFSRWRSADR